MNKLKLFAREMRKEPTQAERILWDVLRNRKFHGLKFKRQVPVEGYIADFMCWDKKLIIELDGPHHQEQKEYDEKRAKDLEAIGFKVVTFKNEDFVENFERVLMELEFFIHPNS